MYLEPYPAASSITRICFQTRTTTRTANWKKKIYIYIYKGDEEEHHAATEPKQSVRVEPRRWPMQWPQPLGGQPVLQQRDVRV